MRIYALTRLDSDDGFDTELLRTLKPHTAPVISSAVDRTGTLFATGGSDGVVKVWDIRGGFTTHVFRGHSGIISSLRFFEAAAPASHVGISARNRRKGKKNKAQDDEEMEGLEESEGGLVQTFRLASGDDDGKVRVWDLHRRNCVAILDSHVSVVRGLDFSSEENALVSGSRDKTIILWDAATWKLRKVIPVLETVEAVGFIAQGSLLYTGGENGCVRLWETNDGREATREQGVGAEGEGIVDIVFQSNLDFLVSVNVDQTLTLHSISPLSDFSEGQTIAPLPIIRQISGTYDEIIDLAYVTRDKSYLALATNTEDIRIVSLGKTPTAGDGQSQNSTAPQYFGADVAMLKGHEDIIICLDTDWSGHWIATGAKDNTARLWRVDPENNSYTCFATFTGHAESLGAIALPRTVPPVGTPAYEKPLEHPPAFLVTGSQDKTIKRWDIKSLLSSSTKKSPRAAYTRKAHEKDINAIDINHTSALFASASQDRTVKIWSAEEGETQGILRGHRRGVWSVKFAPKDTPTITGDGGAASGNRGLVLTGSGDKTVKIWSLTDYSCLRTFEGHTNSVLKVAWLNMPKGEGRDKRDVEIASAGGDGLVKVWDASSGECDCTLDNHEDRVWALTVHPSSNTIVSGGGDSTVTFWADTTSTTQAAAVTASSQRIEQEQKLMNYIHAGSYRRAITLALQLNHPARLLSLFTSVVKTSPPEAGSLSGVLAVDTVIGSLSDEQLYLLLLRLRDWNTNARTAPIAQRIFYTVVKSYPAERLASLKPVKGSAARGKGAASLKELFDAMKAYTERHYRRMEELADESYLVEYTLREMDDVAFADGGAGVTAAIGGGDAVAAIEAEEADAGSDAGDMAEVMDGIIAA
ncbi:WD40 repeat-like protein [Xylona heveae TC161]|uniref:WD40 repeat-like protein n=1 Tax=Xylona heveae (strain CBS 132557 / TC161) TaxID=1328760 RepID=A0A165I9Y3_XYLHT|nr:WD40 repeat-like protein [Xylona heveae TC161]KZF24602.1 WD40 repeat-like protein [Xylona heveae TC161]